MHHPAQSSSEPLLALEEISRRFGTIRANRSISMEIAEGEIHAVVGENGAGKSTLMKILHGEIQQDSGRILLSGKAACFRSPKDAMLAGIGLLHQQILLFPQMTVLENILAGFECGRWGFLSNTGGKRKVQELCRTLGLDVPLGAVAGSIPFAQRQQIELLRVLHRGARLLILDEPTSLLAPPETAKLLNLMQSLRSRGYTLIFISHRLQEVFEVADRITVLRNGGCVGTVDRRSSSMEEVAQMIMTGSPGIQGRTPSEGNETASGHATTSDPSRPLVLEMEGLTVREGNDAVGIENLFLSISGGEVVGVGAVVGNGERSLARVLAGMTFPSQGRISLHGTEITHLPAGPRRDIGVRWLPANPLEESLLPDRPIWENILLGRQRSPAFQRYGILRRGAAVGSAVEQLRTGGAVSLNVAQTVSSLSGGNQQKVALLRAFEGYPTLIILEQPGRGLDIRAQDSLHRTVRAMSDSGISFLIISHDLDELRAMCHRIGILYRGKLMGLVEASLASPNTLGSWMLGLEGSPS